MFYLSNQSTTRNDNKSSSLNETSDRENLLPNSSNQSSNQENSDHWNSSENEPCDVDVENADRTLKAKFSVTKLSALGNMTQQGEEAPITPIDDLPKLDNYRNPLSLQGNIKQRPTLIELQNYNKNDPNKLNKATNLSLTTKNQLSNNHQAKKANVIKFGWIKGVLIRCILNIFGVLIFLRLSWIVGQAGIALTTLAILIAVTVTFITALSTSAICTNGEVKGGGAYYFISRSLGPEFGGAIGLVFSFANAVGVAMNCIGFSETLLSIFQSFNICMIDCAINDIRIIGLVTNCLMVLIVMIGMSYEAIFQIVLLVVLSASFLNFLIGSFLPVTQYKESLGFSGYSLETFKTNFFANFKDGENFASILGVFFPSVTGILAGANISGNLKNPQKAIPKGTLLSIGITSLIYLLVAWIFGAVFVREASGLIEAVSNKTMVIDCQTTNATCKEGLLHNYHTMEIISVYSPIIQAGIFAASLSSALASFVSAPKIFQAVCSDKIFPKLDFFAKGYGKNNEPWRGYALTFVISSFFIGLGSLNLIAPIISNFFLMSYALINYSCFNASLSKAPGWRPSFKFYNKWISLFGACVCTGVMFLIKWWSALLTFIVVISIYIYVKKRKLEINWGSSIDAQIYKRTLEYSLKLTQTEEHVKNFRPNFLVLSGSPPERPALCDLFGALAQSRSLMIFGNVVLSDDLNPKAKEEHYTWLKMRKIKAFYTEVNAKTLRQGASALMQCAGIGKLKPNILVLGFKNNWLNEKVESVLEYYDIINDAFQLEYGVCVLRLEGGLDYSHLLGDLEANELSESDSENQSEIPINGFNDRKASILRHDIESLIARQISNTKHQSNFQSQKSLANIDTAFFKSTELIRLKNTKINQGVLQGVNMFHKAHKNGFVDVWWMYDDGGLSLLLPYLLTKRKYWQKCKLRIFMQTKSSATNLTEEQRNMATFLSKFRIDFHELIVVSTFTRKPKAENIAVYEKMLENWRLKAGETMEEFPWKISESMYKQNVEKINHYMRLRELLLEYSHESSFIFLTISVPNKLSTCAGLYMSFLDLISYQLPPIIMLRGNQTSVLTYYS